MFRLASLTLGKSAHSILKRSINSKLAPHIFKSSTILVLICALQVFSAEAKDQGKILNGREPEFLSHKYKKHYDDDYQYRYHIDCVSIVDSAKVYKNSDGKDLYNGPDGSKIVDFPRGTDLIVDRIINQSDRQLLSGKILGYARGGNVFTWENPKNSHNKAEDIDRLYVIPKEWNCLLGQGSAD